ncbi:MAG: MFS transporter [Clostridiales bacterium]|nr:MFS transporter [Clostridiales bacterium]
MIQILLLIIYVAFISLGLPDGLLGAAWPTMYINIGVPISTAGIISMVIAFGTIISALFSDKLTYLLGTEKVTALSVAMTCVALFGFSFSDNILALLLWSIPYGLGAGSVDAALNNYVAIHYSSRHMSWLHCMWGIGASIGPYLMGYAISSSKGWEQGYIYVGSIQIVLTVVLFLSFPLWKGRSKITDSSEQADDIKPMKLIEIIKIPGVNAVLITFFCYSALESTSGLWAASYLQLAKGIDEGTAASMASLFYIGITVGRAINGFLTIKLSDTKLIRLGQVLVLMGVVILMLPLNIGFTFAGIVIVGLGCAPIYPCIIHSTPARFGVKRSQAIVGVQMASAYIGTMIMPPIFGILADSLGMIIWPFYLVTILLLMIIMHERLIRITCK